MKKIFTFCFIILTTKTWSQSPCVFSIINMYSPGVYSITCANPTLNLTANPANNTYTWVSLTNTLLGTNVGITSIGNYTITCSGVGCSTSTQAISVGMNTVLPTNSVTPTSQAITCASNSAVTFSGTASSPIVNMQHDWYSPLNPLPSGVPIATSNNTLSILSGAIPPGTYTLVTTNLINGCKAQKTVTITSLEAFPTYSVSSPTNFSVGCAPLNQTTISIINPVSTQTPPATCSYTFLPPNFVGVVTPSVALGNTSYTIPNIPGTWTVIVQDNNNFCRTQLTVPITQNTMAPDAGVSMLSRTLTCFNPTLLATGTSTTLNTIITWIIPVPPNQLSTHSVEVGPSNGPPISNNSLIYANYTVVATNTLNACQGSSVIVISQNFKLPVSSPTVSIGSPIGVYCTASLNPVVLSTGSSTTTSGGGPLAFIIPELWEGPAPQATTTGVSTYSCYVPGIYSLTVKDNYNGCTKTATLIVFDKTQPPVVTTPFSTVFIDCGSNQASLQVVLTGTMVGGPRYLITSHPNGAVFSPASANIPNINPLLNGTSASIINVSGVLGTYVCVVTNTLSGCQATQIFKLVLNDPIGQIVTTPAHPSCSVCCDGTIGITPPGGFTNYSVSISSGSLVGSPATSISNLCYGKVVYCFTNLTSYTNNPSPAYCKRCDSVVMDAYTAIKINSIEDEFILYPNPTNSSFYIKNTSQKSGNVKVFNVEGKEIETLVLIENKETKIENLNSGIYFVEIRIENSVVRKKVVVIK